MDGVFMKKTVKFAVGILLIVCLWFVAGFVRDHQSLTKNLVRLHVVANSDSEFDQNVKLEVKDKIASYLSENMEEIQTVEDAKAYILESLQNLEHLAKETLKQHGLTQAVEVTFEEECFDKRVYDTFSLPSGVYQSLRISLGQGEGKNWWCVVFPSLCLPATTAEFQDAAVSSGFHEDLTATLMEEDGYEIRFFFLDY